MPVGLSIHLGPGGDGTFNRLNQLPSKWPFLEREVVRCGVPFTVQLQEPGFRNGATGPCRSMGPPRAGRAPAPSVSAASALAPPPGRAAKGRELVNVDPSSTKETSK